MSRTMRCERRPTPSATTCRDRAVSSAQAPSECALDVSSGAFSVELRRAPNEAWMKLRRNSYGDSERRNSSHSAASQFCSPLLPWPSWMHKLCPTLSPVCIPSNSFSLSFQFSFSGSCRLLQSLAVSCSLIQSFWRATIKSYRPILQQKSLPTCVRRSTQTDSSRSPRARVR